MPLDRPLVFPPSQCRSDRPAGIGAGERAAWMARRGERRRERVGVVAHFAAEPPAFLAGAAYREYCDTTPTRSRRGCRIAPPCLHAARSPGLRSLAADQAYLSDIWR